MVEKEKVPVNARHLKNMILAGCIDRIENVKAVTERYAILKRAALKLGFNLRESDAPEELRDKHYLVATADCSLGYRLDRLSPHLLELSR